MDESNSRTVLSTSFRRLQLPAVLAVGMLALALGAWGLMWLLRWSNSAIPSASWLTKRYAAFVVNAANVEGLYHNEDGNSDIFRYTVSKNHDTALDSILASARGAGWQIVERSKRSVRLQRTWKDRRGWAWEAETRVYVTDSGEVYVGYKPISWGHFSPERSKAEFWTRYSRVLGAARSH